MKNKSEINYNYGSTPCKHHIFIAFFFVCVSSVITHSQE